MQQASAALRCVAMQLHCNIPAADKLGFLSVLMQVCAFEAWGVVQSSGHQ
jgi:hypothetical protein